MAETELRMIPVDKIAPSPYQPRESFQKEGLEELGESIKEAGLVQPILVRKKGSVFQIIAGERRWRSYQLAGMKTIPAILRDVDDIEAQELSLIENWHRLALEPLEAERFLTKLYNTGLKAGRYKSIKDMSRKTGIKFATLQQILEAHEERKELKMADQRTSYVDFQATRPLKGRPKYRKQVLDKRAKGKYTLDEEREVSQVVAKAPEHVVKAVLKPKSYVTPKVGSKLLELPEEKQKSAIKQIESLRLTEDESIAHIEAIKVEEPLPPPEDLEKLRDRYEDLQKEIKAKLDTPEAKERGELFRNWTSHIAIAGILDSLSCPVCKSKQLGWMCHELGVKKALEEAEKKYKASLKED